MTSFNDQMNVLSRLVSAVEQRQQVIAHNIANVNTPNYKRLELDFEKALSNELAQIEKSGKSTAQAQPVVQQTQGLATRADGNNVDIDMEVGQLNKNALLQQMYLQVMSAEMSMMRRAIDGG